ncbi:hypothetical protein Tco_1055899 [Tanacetum coccineum]|uniref:Uncharacterized protein n=1 Tax=Tanacetum coccineum TaxID=301880 RepID=A0ABQ5H0Z0_9ASTR
MLMAVCGKWWWFIDPKRLVKGGYRATHSIDSKVSGGGGGCEVLGGKSSKSSMDGCEEVGVACSGGDGGAWVDSCGGKLVLPRFSDTLGGELVVVLVGDESLDDPMLM